MNRTTVGCLTAALVVALLISIAINVLQSFAIVGQSMVGFVEPKERLREKVEVEGTGNTRDKIAHIDLEGIISSMEMGGIFGSPFTSIDLIKESLQQALKDNHVKAIVLRINSPGGEVTASDTLYAAVKDAATKKPVIAYMDSVAASGGYYVACGATKVLANETTITASIGVIIESFNYHQLFEKVGLESKSFTSGPYKDTLSGGRPMRNDEVIYVQNLVDQMYDRFLGIVAAARKLTREQLKNGIADGRIVVGKDALEARLVDKLGYVEDAYEMARQMGKAPGATVVKYQSTPSLLGALGLAGVGEKTRQQKLEIDLTGGALPRLRAGMPYYLPAAFLR